MSCSCRPVYGRRRGDLSSGPTTSVVIGYERDTKCPIHGNPVPKLYRQWMSAPIATLEPHYSAHVTAMTSEDLHAKSDIAAELAFRDKRIDALRKAIADAELGEGPAFNMRAALDADDALRRRK